MGFSGGLVQLGFVIWALLQGCLVQLLNLIIYIDMIIRGSLFVTGIIIIYGVIELILLVQTLHLVYCNQIPYSAAKRKIAKRKIRFNREVDQKSW